MQNPRVMTSRNGKLIFKDYANREVSISEKDYLDLMSAPERQAIRANLEDCFQDPSEMWWEIAEVEGEKYTVYKYFKLYKEGLFVIYVILDELQNFSLNNFFWIGNDDLDQAEEFRHGMLIFSKLK